MELDPHDKAMIDYVVDQEVRKASRHGWTTVLAILSVSLVFLYLFNHDIVSGWFGKALAIAGILGVLVFLVFLSTKPFGHSNSSFRWWWLR